MAKRASKNKAIDVETATAEPTRLSEVVAAHFTRQATEAAERAEKAVEALVKDISNGYVRRGYLSCGMKELHVSAASFEVWSNAEKIRRERGLESVLAWATAEQAEIVDSQAWESNSTCPWSNVARATEANATLSALSGRYSSVIDMTRYILDRVASGSIIDDTDTNEGG